MRVFTDRERWLLWIFMIAILLGGYLSIVRIPLERRVEAANTKINAGAAPSAVSRARGVAAHQADLDKSLREEHALDSQKLQLLARWAKPRERADVVRRISQLFQESKLMIEGSAAAGAEKTNSGIIAATVVPSILKHVESVMLEFGGAAPVLWHFDLRGPFESLVIALGRLQQLNDAFALPITLGLRPAADADELSIDIYLWI